MRALFVYRDYMVWLADLKQPVIYHVCEVLF